MDQDKITIHEQLENVNQAIQDGEISRDNLKEIQKLIATALEVFTRKKTSKTTGLVQEKHFDEFWEMYPDKKGKQPAQKAWKALCKKKKTRPQWDDIVKGLERYKQADTVENGYILMPAKWIREQRWTDEISNPIKRNKRLGIGTMATQSKEVNDSIQYPEGEIHDV